MLIFHLFFLFSTCVLMALYKDFLAYVEVNGVYYFINLLCTFAVLHIVLFKQTFIASKSCPIFTCTCCLCRHQLRTLKVKHFVSHWCLDMIIRGCLDFDFLNPGLMLWHVGLSCWYFIGKRAKKAKVRDTEEENVHREDAGLPQEEEMGSQTCVTEDVSQKRKYFCCGVLWALHCALLAYDCSCYVGYTQVRDCLV
jgi:hypothetical protein